MMAKSKAWGECGGCEFVGDLLAPDGDEALGDDDILVCELCGAGTLVGNMPMYPAEGRTVKQRKDKYGRVEPQGV